MTRYRRYLVIFARAPRLGVGKRRLAADIGSLKAWQFYRHTLLRLIRRMAGGPWHLVVAVSQASDLVHPAFRGIPTMLQKGNDLGQRMSGVLRNLPPGPAIIIGSDIPAILRGDVAAAFHMLGRHDAVFGPAPDGGYWLLGLARRRPIPRRFMANVRWSSRHALVDTAATLPQGISVVLAKELADVDDGASYQAWRASR